MTSHEQILVTGGAGFIGSHTVKCLLKAGHRRVVVIDNLEHGRRESVLTPDFHQGDLRDRIWLEGVFAQYAFSHVIHCAAYASVPDSVGNPAKYYDNNITGGLVLLETMRRFGVKNIVFSSSAAVYGEPTTPLLDETHPKEPTNPYGRTKLIFEQILRDFHRGYGFNSVALRYFCAAGCDPEGELGEYHDPETHVIPLAIAAALDETQTFRIFGDDYETPDGTAIRDYVHVSDLAQAHVLAVQKLDREPQYCEAFNLGIEKGFSVREIVQAVARVTGRTLRPVIAPRRPGDPTRLVASARRAGTALDWHPQYTELDEMIQTAVRFFLNR